jgi:hypothetical protein
MTFLLVEEPAYASSSALLDDMIDKNGLVLAAIFYDYTKTDAVFVSAVYGQVIAITGHSIGLNKLKSLLATYGQVIAITGHSIGLNKWNDLVTVAKVSLEGMKPVDFANQFEQMGRYIHHAKMIGLGNPSGNRCSAQSDGMPTDPISFMAFLDPQYQKSSTELYGVAKATVCDFDNKVNVEQASQALLEWGIGHGKKMQHYDTLHIMYKHYRNGIESSQPWNVREQLLKFALSKKFDLTRVLGAGRLVDAPVGQPNMTIMKALAQHNVRAALSWSRDQFVFQQPSLADMEYLIPDFYDYILTCRKELKLHDVDGVSDFVENFTFMYGLMLTYVSHCCDTLEWSKLLLGIGTNHSGSSRRAL